MRRGFAAIALVFVILAGVGIGVASYNAGQRNGVAQGVQQVQTAQRNGQTVQVVHVVDEGRPFFLPGFFFFPFLFFGFLFLIAGIMRGAGRWGHGGHGPGPWNEEGRKRFEDRATEWHTRQHGGQPPSGTPPSEATPTA